MNRLTPQEEAVLREAIEMFKDERQGNDASWSRDCLMLLDEIDALRTQNRELEEAVERLKADLKETLAKYEGFPTFEDVIEAQERRQASEQRLSRAIAALKDDRTIFTDGVEVLVSVDLWRGTAERRSAELNDVLAELEK